jgi:nitrogen regulatory protein P-II 1
MKKIEAIIRQEKLYEVKAALEKAGYPGITVSNVQGHGRQKGLTQQWRGMEYKVDLLPKTKIEITVPDGDAERLVQAIAGSAHTGAVGDGKIFVVDVAEVVRIRTGERGEAALN